MKMNALLGVALFIVIVLCLIYFVSKKKFNYWKKKGIPYLMPSPILGNYGEYIMQQKYYGQVVRDMCQRFPGQPYFGAYFGTEPVLIVQSPEILKHVFTKDFYYFNGREVSSYTEKEVVTRNIFFSGGDKWKIVRQNLTPLFSSAKMKNMFYLLEKCGHDFEDMLDRVTSASEIVEVRELSAKFTMDCVCSCAFGIEANTMKEDDNNPFLFMASEIFRATYYRGFKLVIRSIWPALFYGFGFKNFPPTIDTFFSQLLKGVFQCRDYKPSTRNDFVDQVLNLRKEDSLIGDSISNAKTGRDDKVYLKVDDELLVSQCVQFFGAGFETSANTMGFTLYEFAKNQEVQRRVIEELDEYLRRHDNQLTYESVNELPFLEACVYETLRVYPVLGVLTREVMDNYVFSTGLQVDKGVRVHIPVYHMHHNPEYFPEPEKYMPERFLPENKKDLKPYTYFPYGEGPRICIGKRFAKMQVMTGLIFILKNYRVELAKDMPESIIFDPRSMPTQPKDQGLNLKMIKRETS